MNEIIATIKMSGVVILLDIANVVLKSFELLELLLAMAAAEFPAHVFQAMLSLYSAWVFGTVIVGAVKL